MDHDVTGWNFSDHSAFSTPNHRVVGFHVASSLCYFSLSCIQALPAA